MICSVPFRDPVRFVLVAMFMHEAVTVSPAFEPTRGDFRKASDSHVRVLSYNVNANFTTGTSLDSALGRIVLTVDPDVIAFQEIPTLLAEDAIRQWLEARIPSDEWSVLLGEASGPIRNVLATRFAFDPGTTITDTTPPSNTRGVTAALIDLPATVSQTVDLYVMAVHFKSFATLEDHAKRQQHADAIIHWMRDARTTGEHIDLAPGTPILVVGDMNVDHWDQGDALPCHPTRTLLYGDIFDESTYGADSPPDWDGGDSADAAPYDPNTGDIHTHRAQSNDPGSRYDRFIYTDSVLRVANRFILNTAAMSPAALAAAGLLPDDTTTASDHLPIVADFALGPDPNPPGRLLINEFSYNDTGTDDRSFIELRNVGGREIALDAPLDYHLLTSNNNVPTTPPLAENVSLDFDLKGVVPPGGLFVLYDAAGESSAVAARIEAALPALQRQDQAAFRLNNGPDAAIALVTTDNYHEILTTGTVLYTTATLVEAYLYADAEPGGSHFFRTDSANSLLIELTGGQLSTLDLVSDTLSFSRNAGDTTPNSFAGWTLATATPGTPNGRTSARSWTRY